MDAVGLVMFLTLVAGTIALLVWCELGSAAYLEQDDAKFAQSIRHLPAERQANLWLAKLRDDARRDTP